MSLISSLSNFSKSRYAWGLLLILGMSFELCALFFQHVMKLEPCVMCVYERVAMIGLVFAGLIGLINPKNLAIRWLGFVTWGYASYQGLLLALEHTDYQFNPSPFKQCDIFPQFPSWAPLDQWFPWMFNPTGDCSEVVWQFLGYSMPQWLVAIFIVSFAACVVFFIAQLVSKQK